MGRKVMLGCAALAIISAVAYTLMGVGILQAGDLTGDTMPSFYYVIPGGYVVGGLLILVRKRWLWITGAIVNAFTILVFYANYAARPDVMLSAPGLITKIAQVLMEIGLIYLIATYRSSRVMEKAVD